MPKTAGKRRIGNLTDEELDEVLMWLRDRLDELEGDQEYIEDEGLLLYTGLKKLIKCLR